MRADSGRTVLAFALLLCVPAHGFLVQTFEGTRGPVQQRWDRDEVPFIIDAAGSDDMTAEQAIALLRASFEVWNAVPTARVRLVDQGLTSALVPSRNDNRNLVIFDETGDWLDAPPEAGIIAITRINSNANTGRILDADIIFNGRDHRFGSGQSDRVELMDVAVHEIGHLLGLEHTPLDGAAGVRPTMNPYYRGDGLGEASTLEPDDIAGIGALYPAAAFAAQTATMTGHVTDIAESPVFGAHVVAREVSTGAAISTVTGAYPDLGDAGYYRISGLPPGAYSLEIAPITGTITEDNFSGIFASFDTDFPSEFYDNTTRRDLAVELAVGAADNLTDLDFTTGSASADQPYFEPLVTPTNTPDAVGPYPVALRVLRASEALLRVRYDEGPEVRVAMERVGVDTFAARIQGRAAGVTISYQVEATGDEGYSAVFPAEDYWASFDVVELSGAPLALAALRDEDAVSILDTGTGLEIARVMAGDEPIQAVATPDGRRVFVSNLGSDEITVIDGVSLQRVRTVPTGPQPLDLSLSLDGETVYVANSGDGSVTAVEVGTGATTTLPVPGLRTGPYGVAVAGADQLYVTDLGLHEVVVLTSAGRVVERIPVAEQPRSLAVSPDGRRLFVTSFATGALTCIDVSTGRVDGRVELPVDGTFAASVAPDGARVYVSSHSDHSVLAVDARADTLVAVIPVGANPRGLAFSPSGDSLVVTAASSGQLHIIDLSTHQVLATHGTGMAPRGLAVVPGAAAQVPVDTSIAGRAEPGEFTLEAVYPNPFNSATTVAFSLGGSWGLREPVTVSVHNLLGQVVRTLARAELEAGPHKIVWDGRDDRGYSLASGPYFIRLVTPGGQAVARAMLLR